MKVLFLDIDGVLNGHEWDDEAVSCNIRRECVKRLNHVVQQTGCVIVLSSAWRYIVHGGEMTLKGFGYILRTHGLLGGRNLIVGLTRKDVVPVDPLDQSSLSERARQVREWLSDHPEVTAFVAVDDEDHQFEANGVPCVLTDGKVGLTDADAARLIAALNENKE